MIDYTYNTTGAFPEVHGEESRMALLAAEIAENERRNSRSAMCCASECLSFQVSDVGENHAGLRVSLRVWSDGIESPDLDRFYQMNKRKDPWLNIATACLSPLQARELATAILQALAMREFDDEMQADAAREKA